MRYFKPLLDARWPLVADSDAKKRRTATRRPELSARLSERRCNVSMRADYDFRQWRVCGRVRAEGGEGRGEGCRGEGGGGGGGTGAGGGGGGGGAWGGGGLG